MLLIEIRKLDSYLCMREFCKSIFRHRVTKLRVAIRVKLSAQSHPPILMSRVNLSVIHREALPTCYCIAIHNATMKIFPPELAQVFIYGAKCSHGTGV